MSDNLKKAEQIAKDTAETFKKTVDAKALEAKKQTESTEAGKSAEKTEGSAIVAEAEKQAENDARILSAKDEELSVEDKTRKAELAKAKEERERKAEAPEDKVKRIQEATQKRIDEVVGDLKAEKAQRQQDKDKIAELEAKLETLTKPKAEEDKASKLKTLVEQQTAKYLQEDKNKPRGEKREMPKEELEEWLIEDYVSATEWLTDRSVRRHEDKAEIEVSLSNAPQKKAEEFISQQQESLKKLIAKYPSVVPSPERLAQLKGKTKDEIDEILASENEDYRDMLEIVRTDTKKYLGSVDGPEKVMEELDRRRGKSRKTITLTEDELNQRIKDGAVAEAQRIANLDESVTSSGGKKVEKQENKSEFRKKQEEVARKAGITIEQLDGAIKRRETIGVMSSNAEDFNKD